MTKQRRSCLAPAAGCLLLLLCLLGSGCGSPESGGAGAAGSGGSGAAASAVKVKYEDLSVSGPGGAPQAVPLRPDGLTVVNLFDEFCTECAGGRRLQTLERIQRAAPRATVLTVFSSDEFTEQDLENFKMMLDTMTESMVRGSTRDARRGMVNQQLLVVLNPRKEVVWQEAAGMSEEEIFKAVERVIKSGAS